MIVKNEFLKKLKDLGLNTYESKLWTALLSRGISTAGELSDIANVPRSRSYDVLESLEKKGFIVMKLGKPIKYVAVSPQEVLDRVQNKIREEATVQVRRLEDLKDSDILDELNTLHVQGVELVDPADLTGSLKGRGNLYNHIESLLKKAESSIYIMTSADGLLRKADFLEKQLKEVNKKGISVKIAIPYEAKVKNVISRLKDYAEIKDTNDIFGRFIAIDNKELTFMLLDDKLVHPNYDAGIWINSPFFVNTLVDLFDKNWDSMKKIQ